MERSGMAFVHRGGGAAHKAVTLDLMLRTFMNSPDFQPSNPRMWEGIARLVPGTTPQQCLNRWEELRSSSKLINRDYSSISARGKPLSPHHEYSTASSTTNLKRLTASTSPSSKQPLLGPGERYQFASVPELPPILSSSSRPSTARDYPTYDHQQYRGSVSSQYRMHSGQFTAAFCQSHLYGKKKHEDNSNNETSKEDQPRDQTSTEDERISDVENEEITEERVSNAPSINVSANVSPSISNQSVQRTPSELSGKQGDELQNILLIHVKDEAKKVNKDFKCPREVLIREMRYFDDYLSSPSCAQWEEVDISVHCDVSVFHWLMAYAKRGMLEDPSGDLLDQPLKPDTLDPFNVISILISSDFLKMDSLVEECILYCYEHLSDIVCAPCNMNCIADHLLARIAAKFTHVELEKVTDPKDKIKSKLFAHKLESMFSTNGTTPPVVNGLNLFKCKHCGCLLTREQQLVFPCASNRLKVDRSGALIYQHEGETSWNIDKHISGLRKQGLTWRDIYWRLWGVITWFKCSKCSQPFQCGKIQGCLYHPGTIICSNNTSTMKQYYTCCNKPMKTYSPLMTITQDGCCSIDHTLEQSSTSSLVPSVLSMVRDLVCSATHDRESNATNSNNESNNTTMSSLLKNEQGHQNMKKGPSLHVVKQGGSSSLIHRPNSTSTSIRKTHSLPLANDETIEPHPSTRAIPKLKKQVKMVRRSSALEDEESTSSEDDSSSTSSSDMEEDEPEEPTRITQKQKVMKITTKQKKAIQTKKCLRSRSSERCMDEWEWDCRKSTRWNQDMQRDDDNRKMAALKRHLQQISITSNNDTCSNSSSSNGKGAGVGSTGVKTSNSKINHSTSNSGGIYCRIDAQFRAQRMVANGLSVKQSGHRSFRKSNYSKTN